jgi:hypothetical protein
MTDAPERIWAGNWLADVGETSVWDIGEWRDEPWQTVDAVEYVRADLATPAPAVKVKALVWTECNSGNFKQGHCFTARSMVDFAPIAVHKKADGWWLNKDCTTYPTMEAAKAAAQADYEATILAALELANPLDDPRVKALVEAGKAVVDRWDSPLWKDLPHTGESISDLRAALSALEENK